MGFTSTTLEPKTAPRKTPSCSQKNASRKFFSYPVKTSHENRSNSLKTSLENPIYSYKIASGRSSWPSRDPLGDTAFLQTYIKECNKGEKCAKKREAKLLNLRKESQKNLYVFIDNTPITHYDQHGLVLGWGYGNYCGYSRFGQNGAPIDGVDLACAKHDVCLATPREVFRFKCCNLKFLKAVRKANCRFDLNGKRRAVKDINRCRRAKAVIFGPGGLITLLTLPV